MRILPISFAILLACLVAPQAAHAQYATSARYSVGVGFANLSEALSTSQFGTSFKGGAAYGLHLGSGWGVGVFADAALVHGGLDFLGGGELFAQTPSYIAAVGAGFTRYPPTDETLTFSAHTGIGFAATFYYRVLENVAIGPHASLGLGLDGSSPFGSSCFATWIDAALTI